MGIASITENPDAFFAELNAPENKEKEPLVEKQEAPKTSVAETTSSETGGASIKDNPSQFFASLEEPVTTKAEPEQWQIASSIIAGEKPEQITQYQKNIVSALPANQFGKFFQANPEVDPTPYLNNADEESLYSIYKTRPETQFDDKQLDTIYKHVQSKPFEFKAGETWDAIKEGTSQMFGGTIKGTAKVLKDLFPEELPDDVTPEERRQSFSKRMRDLKSDAVVLLDEITNIPVAAVNFANYHKGFNFGVLDDVLLKTGTITPDEHKANWMKRASARTMQANRDKIQPTAFAKVSSELVKTFGGIPSPEEIQANNPKISYQDALNAQNEIAMQAMREYSPKWTQAALDRGDENVRIAGSMLIPAANPFAVGINALSQVGKGLGYAKQIADINAAVSKIPKASPEYVERVGQKIADAERRNAARAMVDEQLKQKTILLPSLVSKAAGLGLKGLDLTEKAAPALASVGIGGLVGYEEGRQHGSGLMGAIVGGLTAGAAKKAGVFTMRGGLNVIKDVAEAQKMLNGGIGNAFKLAGNAETASKPTKWLFGGDSLGSIVRRDGAQWMADNAVPLALKGVEGGALAGAMGILNDTPSEDLPAEVINGAIMMMVPTAAHAAISGNPINMQARMAKETATINNAISQMSPETQSTINSLGWNQEVARRKMLHDSAIEALAESNQEYANAKTPEQKAKWGEIIKSSEQALDYAQRNYLKSLNANNATRLEYNRQLKLGIAKMTNLFNGVSRAGQPNVNVEILTTEQIRDKLLQNSPEYVRMMNSGDPAQVNQAVADATMVAEQHGFNTDPTGTRRIDPRRMSVVVNADNLGKDPRGLYRALLHELGHAGNSIPEFRDALQPAREQMFQEIHRDANGEIFKQTEGIYSDDDLMRKFFEDYMSNRTPEKVIEFARGARLMSEDGAKIDKAKLIEYMKEEIMADVLASSLHSRTSDGAGGMMDHIRDWAKINFDSKKSAKMILKAVGEGATDPRGSREYIPVAGAEPTEQARQYADAAVDSMRELDGAFSSDISSEVDRKPKMTRANFIKNKAILERYGKDSGLVKTQMRATIVDRDGNIINKIDITNPMAAEGSWNVQPDGTTKQLKGYGQIPDELSGLTLPEGAHIKVANEIVYEPDGNTPVFNSSKEVKKILKNRAQAIRDAIIKAPDDGTPNRFDAYSEDELSMKGLLQPSQIKAIMALPETIVPYKIKENILRIDNAIKNNIRMWTDYSTHIDPKTGKYTGSTPVIRDNQYISMHFSKNGNFTAVAVSWDALHRKMRMLQERVPSFFDLWGGSAEEFYSEFTNKYLKNIADGVPNETGLDADKETSIAKRNKFRDFLAFSNNSPTTIYPEKTIIPRKKGEKRADLENVVRSFRLDAIIDMTESPSVTPPISYNRVLQNFFPKAAEERPVTGRELEQGSRAINLGIKAARTNENLPLSARYVAPTDKAETAPVITGYQQRRGVDSNERGIQFMPSINEDIQDISKRYVESVGITHNPHNVAVPVNEPLAKRIADYYQEQKDSPADPDVYKAYSALADEVVKQWKEFEASGYRAEPWTKEGQPYANSKEMMDDVKNNKHIYYFQTEGGFGETGITDKMREENPMLSASGVDFGGAKNVPINDVFRVVHDIVGHGANGYEFGPKGEFNAYLEHSRMFSDDAKPALAAETLAQNSWVNYGPHLRDANGNIPKKGEEGYVPVTERPFAEQKNIIIPKEFLDEVDAHASSQKTIGNNGISFMPSDKESIATQFKSKPLKGSVKGKTFDLVHFGASGLKKTDPKKMGKGMATSADVRGTYKTYFYVNGTNYESAISGGSPYIARVDGNSIYDLRKDHLGVLEMTNREKMEEAIKDAGYAGYYSPKSFSGAAFDAVAMFKPVALTEASPSDIYSKRKLAEIKKSKATEEEAPDYQALDDAWRTSMEMLQEENRKKSGISFMPSESEEKIVGATYTNPKTGKVSRGISHIDANPNAPKEATDREAPAYGFETSAGRIVDRNEAYKIAQESGQLKEPTTEDQKFNADRGVLHSDMVDYAKPVEKPAVTSKRDPELQKAAKDLDEGKISLEEYDAMVRAKMPYRKMEEVPVPATTEEMKEALYGNAKDPRTGEIVPKSTLVGVARKILKTGERVGIRLDINAYEKFDTWVPTIHKKRASTNKGSAGDVIGYDSAVHLKNGDFGTSPKAALSIAKGSSKTTIATAEGEWQNTSPEAIKAMADEAINDPEWIQVGMNPVRGSGFYNRETGERVKGFDELLQVGGLVLAKGAKYFTPEEFKEAFAVQGKPDIVFMPREEQDRAHADLEARYKAGDAKALEEAQRLLDEQAKAKGLPIVTLWRGFRKTPNPEQLRTTAGRATTSYTPVEEVAKLYSHDPSTLKQGKGASVKKIYLDLKNPLDLREEGTKVSLGNIIENYTKWDLSGSDNPSGIDAHDIVDVLDELTILHEKTGFEYEIDHSDDGFFKMRDFDDLKEYIEERANRIEEAAKNGEEDENSASEIFYALNDTTLDAYAIGDSSELVYALQKNGYDGIIHRDTIEAGKNYFTKESVAGRPIEEVEGIDVEDDYSHDTYRPFNQNQIKLADPFTYDNEGNLIPLSQRFDLGKQDIRFMPSDGGEGFYQIKESDKYILPIESQPENKPVVGRLTSNQQKSIDELVEYYSEKTPERVKELKKDAEDSLSSRLAKIGIPMPEAKKMASAAFMELRKKVNSAMQVISGLGLSDLSRMAGSGRPSAETKAGINPAWLTSAFEAFQTDEGLALMKAQQVARQLSKADQAKVAAGEDIESAKASNVRKATIDQGMQFVIGENNADKKAFGSSLREDEDAPPRVYASVVEGQKYGAQGNYNVFFEWDKTTPMVITSHHHYGVANGVTDIHKTNIGDKNARSFGNPASEQYDTLPSGKKILNTRLLVGNDGAADIRAHQLSVSIPASGINKVKRAFKSKGIDGAKAELENIIASQLVGTPSQGKTKSFTSEEGVSPYVAVQKNRTEAYVLNPDIKNVKRVTIVSNKPKEVELIKKNLAKAFENNGSQVPEIVVVSAESGPSKNVGRKAITDKYFKLTGKVAFMPETEMTSANAKALADIKLASDNVKVFSSLVSPLVIQQDDKNRLKSLLPPVKQP